ncbi:hypothetical protein [Streptomyces sp. NPDC056291]|uniref:hypothetical protein n=1 Tax=Streptomyces sp. NPDC056291 TaxID=3345772 RepID=UPI0035D5B7ED
MSFYSANDWAGAASLLGVEYDPASLSARAAIESAGFMTHDLSADATAEEHRLLGRRADIPQPYPEVVIRASAARSLRDAMDDPWRPLWELDSAAERFTRAAVRKRAKTLSVSKSWEVSAGRVQLSGGVKRFTGTCKECGHSFSVSRPAVSSRRWPQICDGCKREAERRRKREWARRKRAAQARAA